MNSVCFEIPGSTQASVLLLAVISRTSSILESLVYWVQVCPRDPQGSRKPHLVGAVSRLHTDMFLDPWLSPLVPLRAFQLAHEGEGKTSSNFLLIVRREVWYREGDFLPEPLDREGAAGA